MNEKHLQELLAIFLIGEGVVLAVKPKRHLRLWEESDPLPGLVGALLRHPRLSRVIGVAAAATGLWWASRLKPIPR